MEASIVDLRYKMNDVLKALERNETVVVLHRGKIKGTLIPHTKGKNRRAEKHPFFGSASSTEKTVEEVMADLRGLRHDAL